jgi:hypothetical protein
VDTNPYAPPSAVVADVIAPSSVPYAEPPFFAVSLLKLFVVGVCTFGLYEVYWFAEQWKAVARREKRALNPYLRAILTPLFCYQCFARIRDYDAGPRGSKLPAGPLAIGFVVTTMFSRLPDPYWLFAMYLPPLCLVAVQRRVNSLNGVSAPSHEPNAKFTAWNWAAIALGSVVLAGATVTMVLGIK